MRTDVELSVVDKILETNSTNEVPVDTVNNLNETITDVPDVQSKTLLLTNGETAPVNETQTVLNTPDTKPSVWQGIRNFFKQYAGLIITPLVALSVIAGVIVASIVFPMIIEPILVAIAIVGGLVLTWGIGAFFAGLFKEKAITSTAQQQANNAATNDDSSNTNNSTLAIQALLEQNAVKEESTMPENHEEETITEIVALAEINQTSGPNINAANDNDSSSDEEEEELPALSAM